MRWCFVWCSSVSSVHRWRCLLLFIHNSTWELRSASIKRHSSTGPSAHVRRGSSPAPRWHVRARSRGLEGRRWLRRAVVRWSLQQRWVLLLLPIARVTEGTASCILDGLIATILRIEQLTSASFFPPCSVEVVRRNLPTVMWGHLLVCAGILCRETTIGGLLLYWRIDLYRRYLLDGRQSCPWRFGRSSIGRFSHKCGLLGLAFQHQA
jgi:hypothetical protein